MTKILIINGPNLNMLGIRQPKIYGSKSLKDIKDECGKKCDSIGFELEFIQSNNEGQIIDWIHETVEEVDGVIINAGAYTHTSLAIGDALILYKCPIIELHISNVFKREEIRKKSYISKVSDGIICGFGTDGYCLALDAMNNLISKR